MRAAVAFLALAISLASVKATHEMMSARVRHQQTVTGFHREPSDLFPRWLGGRALLAGRDPYSEAFTAELQREFYGREYPPEEEVTRFRSKVGFFYPPYVVVTLAPLLPLSFDTARAACFAALALAVAAGLALWLRLVGGLSRARALAMALILVTFDPLHDLLWLQQLSGFVLFYLLAAVYAASRERFVVAGLLLGLSAIKPQLAALPVAAVAWWSLWDRRRWPLLAALAATVAAQLVLSEVLSPGWLPRFLAETNRYRALNFGLYWVPQIATGSVLLGAVLIAAPLVGLTALSWWRARHHAMSSPAMLRSLTLTFTTAVAILPADSSTYNRTLLLVPLVGLLAYYRGRKLWPRLARRVCELWVVLPVLLLALSTLGNLVGADATAIMFLRAMAVSGWILLPLAMAPAAVLLTLPIESRG